MNPLSVGAFASVATQPDDRAGRAFSLFKALLLVSALLGGGLAGRPADASLLIETTGTITSGSETGGLFGLGAGPRISRAPATPCSSSSTVSARISLRPLTEASRRIPSFPLA